MQGVGSYLAIAGGSLHDPVGRADEPPARPGLQPHVSQSMRLPISTRVVNQGYGAAKIP